MMLWQRLSNSENHSMKKEKNGQFTLKLYQKKGSLKTPLVSPSLTL